MAMIAIVVIVAAVTVALLLLFPGQKIPGAQRRDIELTDSAYGRFLPIGRGRVRINGDLVWGRKVRAKEVKAQGGKGGGGGGAGGFEYFADLIYAVSDASIFGPAKAILKVWANGNLIYDATGESELDVKTGVTIRFILGGMDQSPDVMQIEDENKWAQGHPGTILVALENFPLEHSSNNIPQLGVEVDYENEIGGEFTNFVGPEGSDDPTERWCLVNYTAKKIFTPLGPGGFYQPEVEYFEYGLDTLAEIQSHDTSILTGDGGGAMELRGIDQDTGYLYGWHSYDPTGPETFAMKAYVYDPITKTVITNVSFPESSFEESPSDFNIQHYPIITSPDGTKKAVFSSDFDDSTFGATANRTTFLNFPALTFNRIASSADPGLREGSPLRPKWMLGSPGVRHGSDTMWIMWESFDNLEPQSYQIDNAGVITRTVYTKIHRTTFHATDSFNKLNLFTHPLIDSNGDLIYYTPMGVPDAGSDRMIWFRWKPSTEAIIWQTERGAFAAKPPVEVIRANIRINGGELLFEASSGEITHLDLQTGVFTTPQKITDAEASSIENPSEWWDDIGRCLYAISNNFILFQQYQRWCLPSTNDGFVSLQDILREICTRLKLVEGTDFDVSAVTDGPWGWVIDKRQSGAAAIKKVLAYFYTLVGTQDGKVVFRDRGEVTTGTIDIGHFVVTTDSKIPWTITQADFEDLPSGAEVEFMDPDRDYEPGLAEHHRNNFPDVVIERSKPISLKGDVAMNADQAGPIAYNLTYIPWKEIDTIKGKLPFWYIKLVSNDAVLIDFGDGNPLRARVKKADWTSDGVVDFEAVFEEAGALIASEFATSTGTFFRTGVLQFIEDTAVQFLDINLLRDTDDLNQTGANTYAGLTGKTNPTKFSAGTLFRTEDGLNYTDLFSVTQGMLFGITDTLLSTPLTPWGTKFGDFIDVTFIDEGENPLIIQSITYQALLNDANPLIILKAGGVFEMIQYMTVTDLGGGSYRFTDLLRGRRGTDTMVDGNTVGDTIILPTLESLRRFSTVPGSLGSSRDYRAVTQGALFESAEDQPFTVVGNDLKPYAPVLPVLTRPTADILGTFKRRPRIGTGVALGVWVHPLAEATEAYEIDIKDGPMGTVVRTLAVTTTAFTYLDADQTTDGFTGSETVMTFEVFQMSAVVGRGYSYEFTEEIG